MLNILNFINKKEFVALKQDNREIKNELSIAIDFAKNLENTKLELEIEEHSRKSDLLTVLSTLRKRLIEISRSEQKRNWRNEGINELSDILRRIINSESEELADRALAYIVKYMKANQGGIFYLNNDNPDDPFIEEVATYAYDRKKYSEHRRIEIGNGQIGQLFLEKETIYLKDVPEDFVRITSGLGEALPRSIILVPLIHEDKVYGALELASFYLFEEHEIEFLEYIGSMMASSLATLKSSRRTERLLEQSQNQAEELRAAEEEMRQNMEEMQAMQENLARKESESRAIINAIDQSLIQGEFDMEGHITNANGKFLELTGLQLDEVMGMHYKSFNKIEEEAFQQLWQPVVSGQIQNFENRIEHDGNSYWFQSSLSPVLDVKGNVIKIISLSIDITNTKKKEQEATIANQQLAAQEEELRQNLEEMQSIQEDLAAREAESSAMLVAINHSLIRGEFSLEGRIQHANDLFLEMTGLDMEQVKGMHYCDFNKISKKEFEDFWQPVLKGEVLNFENKIEHDEKAYWFQSSLSPVLNQIGEVTKVISLSINITETKRKEQEALETNQQMAAQEEELRQNLEEMQTIQETIAEKEAISSTMLRAINTDHIYGEFTNDGHILHLNDRIVDLFEIPMEFLKGKHHSNYSLVRDRDPEEYSRKWRSIQSGESQVFASEIRLEQKTIYLEERFTPIKNKYGEIEKVIMIGTDITGTKEMEQRLCVLEEQVKEQEDTMKEYIQSN